LEKENNKIIEEKNKKISLRSFLLTQMDYNKIKKNLEKNDKKIYKEKYENDYLENLKEKKETSERV
jgi:hypothetical protein